MLPRNIQAVGSGQPIPTSSKVSRASHAHSQLYVACLWLIGQGGEDNKGFQQVVKLTFPISLGSPALREHMMLRLAARHAYNTVLKKGDPKLCR